MDVLNKNEVKMDWNSFKAAMHDATANPPWRAKNTVHQQRWNPYSMEGGTACALAGYNFVVAASDTRMSAFEVSVMNREAEKVNVLNDNIILATTGFYGDVIQLKRVLESRLHKYRFDYRCDMTVDLCSELLARNLYYKRFFPYYTGAILCGIDEKGCGAVYSYDPVGCIERLPYSCSGGGEPMMQPFLDNQVGHMTFSDQAEKPQLTIDRAISLVKDAFKSVAERETSTGDKINIVIAEHNRPIRRLTIQLRED
ncbi:unnamed protein product [Bursaphelenchus xylophilus]|nr:unnamed protein product [Bursaphelenchus xylophilus]CAG9128084.1 unnamed protein product [Bursaphelenchus xylophilus]